MYRFDVINYIIKKFNYKTYLEIGIDKGICFDMIDIQLKHGVDPFKKCMYEMTSDRFFEINVNKYDIIFVDAWHMEDQALKDIGNSINTLTENGTVVVHDCNPLSEIVQRSHRRGDKLCGSWMGTVWKAWVTLRMTRADLKMFVVDADCGMGIIRKGKQTLVNTSDLMWSFFDKNRISLLNLKPAKGFMNEL